MGLLQGPNSHCHMTRGLHSTSFNVDQPFVRSIEKDQESRTVTEAIIALRCSLSREMIADGIGSERHCATRKNTAVSRAGLPAQLPSSPLTVRTVGSGTLRSLTK